MNLNVSLFIQIRISIKMALQFDGKVFYPTNSKRTQKAGNAFIAYCKNSSHKKIGKDIRCPGKIKGVYRKIGQTVVVDKKTLSLIVDHNDW